MKTFLKYSLVACAILATAFVIAPVFAFAAPVVNAGQDLYVTAGQNVTLYGTAYDPNGYGLNYNWSCSGGSLQNPNSLQATLVVPSYGGQTSYVCTLTATNSYGMSASDSTAIFANYGNSGTYYSGLLNVDKRAINLTSGNLTWTSYASARPGDVLSFAITMQAGGRDIHNVTVRDSLPANLLYKGNLTVNTTQSSGDIFSGINIGTIYANQAIVISYQVQVPLASGFAYGVTTINSTAVVTSAEVGTQTAAVSVAINNSAVYGASTISTGTTNSLLKDSFFLPLVLLASAFFIGVQIVHRRRTAKAK